MTPLQLSWVVDYAPAWLSLLLLSGGVGVSVASVYVYADPGLPLLRRLLGGAITGLGTGMLFYGTLLDYGYVTAILATVVARYVEGLAAVRLYQKVSYVLRERRYPGAYTPSVGDRARLALLALFAVIIAGWVGIAVVVWGPVAVDGERTLRLLWTLATVVLSVLGLSIRFLSLTDELPGLTLLGLVLLITGAEIYNLTSLRLDVAVYLLSMAAYTVGFWVAATSVLRDETVDLTAFVTDDALL